MTRSNLVALALAAVVLTGCTSTGTDPAPAPTPTDAPSVPSPSPTSAPTAAPIVASWDPHAAGTELPEGWSLRPCNGDAPIVCVHRGEVVVGTLALDSFPLDDDLAAAEGDEVVAALRTNATARMQGLVEDRAIGCQYDVATDPLHDVDMGGHRGVRAGMHADVDGATAEHVVTYATVAHGQLWILVAESAAHGTCMADPEMDLFTPSDLEAFLPVLDRVVAGTPLPVAGSRVEEGTVLGLDGGLDGGSVVVFVGGELHPVEARELTSAELEAEGVAIERPVTHVRLAPEPTGSWFARIPSGGDATDRLLLVVGAVAHPVVVQQVTDDAVAGIPVADGPELERLTAA